MAFTRFLPATALLLLPAAATLPLLPACGNAGATPPTSTVLLCDGETSVQVDDSAPKTRENGQQIAANLMAQWLAKNPDTGWEADVRRRHHIEPSADNSDVLAHANAEGGEGGQKGHTGSAFTEKDVLIWKRETERFVANGARIFHDGDALGSTIAVSCDMCHPDASNTHPETYPKFQVQLGKVALLRDMINWCVEHPVRGAKLDPDGETMRALEAYILAQRRGKAMAYGKH
jgi:hypothetical protein